MHRSRQPMDRNMMREMNRNLLLNLIRTHAPVSRSQLKQLSGLSMGTIVGITSLLIEQQLVIETGVAESTGGRKAELLEIAPQGGFVAGIELREYDITGVVLNLHGNVVFTETWPAHLRNNSDRAVDIIVEGVETFIAHAPVSRDKIFGLGCGVSGPVNTATGSCVDSWILDWHNVPLSKPLGERLKLPVFVENSVNCLASYEKLYGHGRKYRDFLLVTLGRGLGLAVVMHEDLFRGAQGMGAEFGHIPFNIQGRRCECGNIGCLEAYVANHGVLTTYRELQRDSTMDASAVAADSSNLDKLETLFTRAMAGDQAALKTLELTGIYLGQGLASLINLFNPECIILNSDYWYHMDLLMKSLKDTMHKHIFSQMGVNLEFIVKQRATQENWARGAGCVVLREFFSSPV